MSYQVKFTPIAFAGLSLIFRRIGIYSSSRENRDKRVASISKAIFSLDELPYRCPLLEKEPYHSQGIRKMPAEGYIVYYKVSERKKSVEIHAITHGKQDQEKILNDIFIGKSESADKHIKKRRKNHGKERLNHLRKNRSGNQGKSGSHPREKRSQSLFCDSYAL